MMTAMLIAFGYDEYGNAPHLLAPMDADRIDQNIWYRAGQETICSVCGLPYRLHPEVQGCRWLRRVCSGDLVKL